MLVRGLNVLAATISTPLAAPVTAAVRLRGGSAASARGAASFITEAVGTAQDTGYSGTIVVRMDSAYYSSAAVQAVRRAGAYFSVTAQLNASVKAAIAAIPAAGAGQAGRVLTQCYRPVATVKRHDYELAGGPALSGPGGRGRFTVVVTKSGLTLPHLAVVAGLAVAWYAIGIPRRTS